MTTLQHPQEDVEIIADTRCIGEQYVITPRHKIRAAELIADDKYFNRTTCSAKVAIENLNQHIKQCAILGHLHRKLYDDFHTISKTTHIVSSLCSLIL
ncbi:unnamed protein product, partial [Rotaria sp. Silwood1]